MDTPEKLKAKIAVLETALADYMQRYGATELARLAMISPHATLASARPASRS